MRIIPDKYASAYIQYSRGHIISQIITMIKQFGEYLYDNNVQLLIYIVLFIALIAFILKNNNTLFIKMLWVLIEIGSLSFMQIVSGTFNQLPRTCLYQSVFWAVAVVALYLQVKKSKLQYVVLFLISMLVINNAIQINKVLYCDDVKNQRDVAVAEQIYADIQKIDDYQDKAVVFLGAIPEYKLPYNISLGRDSIFRHDIIGENCLSYETLNFRIYSFFRLIGIPVKEADDNDYMKALLNSGQYSTYPKDGYIGVMDDLIIIKLGDCSAIKTIDINQLQMDESLICTQVDKYSSIDGVICAQGWGYIQGITSHRVKKYLAFVEENSKVVYMIRCANIKRDDVVDSLGIENSYRWCGFNIEVNPDILPLGNYNVKLVLETAGKIYDTGQQLENINIK